MIQGLVSIFNAVIHETLFLFLIYLGGRGGDWNRSSNESGGRGGWGSSANAYPPPQEDYRRQQHGGGGYGNHQNRYFFLYIYIDVPNSPIVVLSGGGMRNPVCKRPFKSEGARVRR